MLISAQTFLSKLRGQQMIYWIAERVHCVYENSVGVSCSCICFVRSATFLESLAISSLAHQSGLYTPWLALEVSNSTTKSHTEARTEGHQKKACGEGATASDTRWFVSTTTASFRCSRGSTSCTLKD